MSYPVLPGSREYADGPYLDTFEINRELAIDYLNTHGTSTPVGDMQEVRAMQAVFGDAVPPFSSTKSLTGHSLGATGVQEAIYCLIMLNKGFIAGSANVETPDPLLAEMPLVTTTRDAQLTQVLSNSFGFGGTNGSLIFARYPNAQDKN